MKALVSSNPEQTPGFRPGKVERLIAPILKICFFSLRVWGQIILGRTSLKRILPMEEAGYGHVHH